MNKKLLNKVMKKFCFLECSDKSDSEEFIYLIINAEETGNGTSTAKIGTIFAEPIPLPLQPTDGTNGMLLKKRR